SDRSSPAMAHPRPPFTSFLPRSGAPPQLLSFPTRRSSDLPATAADPRERRRRRRIPEQCRAGPGDLPGGAPLDPRRGWRRGSSRSEEHTSELQSRENLVCRLLLEKKRANRWATLVLEMYGA